MVQQHFDVCDCGRKSHYAESGHADDGAGMRLLNLRLLALGTGVVLPLGIAVALILRARQPTTFPAATQTDLVVQATQVVERVAASLPAPTATPDPFAACQHDPANLAPLANGTTFHTCGARILGVDGQALQLTAVTWFGIATGTDAPHGLWTRNSPPMPE